MSNRATGAKSLGRPSHGRGPQLESVYAHHLEPLPRQGFRRSRPWAADGRIGSHGTSMARRHHGTLHDRGLGAPCVRRTGTSGRVARGAAGVRSSPSPSTKPAGTHHRCWVWRATATETWAIAGPPLSGRPWASSRAVRSCISTSLTERRGPGAVHGAPPLAPEPLRRLLPARWRRGRSCTPRPTGPGRSQRTRRERGPPPRRRAWCR